MIKKSGVHLLLPVFCLLLVFGMSNCYACITDQDKSVDWYVALRVPNSRSYMIYEPKTKSFRTTTEKLLQKGISTLGNNNTKVMLWNDQTATEGTKSTKAHAKGILHFNPDKGGFLMIHSIPQFVDTTNSTFNHVTKESSSYGQSIVCVSLKTEEQVNLAIDHIMAQNSFVYYNTFNETSKPKTKVDRMISAFPFRFTLVTKTSISSEHPFEDLLVGYYKTSWLVNTWGRPYKASDCDSKYKISNVVIKQFDSTVTKNTQDHSKWALSMEGTKNIVCIGDLNHMDSQASRGGSFLCKNDVNLHKAILNLVLQDECELTGDDEEEEEE